MIIKELMVEMYKYWLSIDVLASQLLYLSAYEMRLLLWYMTEVCNTSSGIQDFFFFLQLLEFIFYLYQHTSPCIHDCSVKQHLAMNENWKWSMHHT